MHTHKENHTVFRHQQHKSRQKKRDSATTELPTAANRKKLTPVKI
jgi:hypothetical protein